MVWAEFDWFGMGSSG